MEVRLIIAGSRDFNNYELLKKEVDEYFLSIVNDLFSDLPVGTTKAIYTKIVSGGARGADRLGERYARERSLAIKQFIPNWGSEGKKAGRLRNEEMAEYSNYCICFWNGSPGTASLIRLAKKYKLGLKVVNVDSTNEKE